MPLAATWIQLEITKYVRKTNTIWYHLHIESKTQHKQIYSQNRNRLTDTGNRLVVVGGEGREGWSGRSGVADGHSNKVLQ